MVLHHFKSRAEMAQNNFVYPLLVGAGIYHFCLLFEFVLEQLFPSWAVFPLNPQSLPFPFLTGNDSSFTPFIVNTTFNKALFM